MKPSLNLIQYCMYWGTVIYIPQKLSSALIYILYMYKSDVLLRKSNKSEGDGVFYFKIITPGEAVNTLVTL